ncbi:MAG: DUF4369 domain-containing protein, partial [Sediminibacterium sp.]
MLSRIFFTFIIGISLFVSGCKNAESGGTYSVTGKIKNGVNQKLLLQEIPYGGKPIITLDSITLDKEGRFNFQFIAKQEGIYRLATDKEFEIIFINDEDNVIIDADATNFNAYDVSGSESSLNMFNFLKTYREKDSSLFATLYNLDILQKQNGKDSSIFWLQKQKIEKIKQLNDFVETSITHATSPAFIYYTLGLSLRSMESAKVLALAKAAAEKTKATPLVEFANLINAQVQANTKASPLNVGELAPEIAMQDANGKIITLSSLK